MKPSGRNFVASVYCVQLNLNNVTIMEMKLKERKILIRHKFLFSNFKTLLFTIKSVSVF